MVINSVKADIVPILRENLPPTLQEEIGNALQNTSGQTQASQLLALCQVFNKQIDVVIKEQYIKQANAKIELYKTGNKSISEEAEQALMVYGARLIYLIRQFINQDELVFYFGTSDSKGQHKHSAIIPLDEVLKNLSVTTKNRAVGLSTKLQNKLIVANQNMYSMKRRNQWTQVMLLSEFKGEMDNTNKRKINLSADKNKPHWAYQNQKHDFMIYQAMSGNHKERYYNISGGETPDRNDLISINTGWLWEWYNKILQSGSDDLNSVVEQSIRAGSLRPIIQMPDFIRGTKQGDYQDLLGRQVQTKYNNTKIISFNNIRQAIFELIGALSEYVQSTTSKELSPKLINVLNQHFIPESAEIGEKVASTAITEQLISKLNIKN